MQMKDDARITLIVSALRRHMDRNQLSQVKFAADAGVDQSQLPRILAGKSKRIRKNMQILMEHAGVGWDVARARPPVSHHPLLFAAVNAAWDGSSRGGNALARLIDAAAEFQKVHAR